MNIQLLFFSGPWQHLDTFCGSPPYAAPELFSDDHYIGGPVDVWALGVLIYFMVVGNMPFRAPTVPALRAAVLKGDYTLSPLLSLPCIRLIRELILFKKKHFEIIYLIVFNIQLQNVF